VSVATVTWKADEFVADVRGAVAVGLTAGAKVIADEMRRNMGSEGGGVVGNGGKSGKRNIYKSSPPGAFPGIRTGQLWRSIMHTEATASQLIASAGSAAAKGKNGEYPDRYGLMLEYGTRKMAPRPWILRSFNRAKDRAFEMMANASRAEFQRITDRRADA